MGDGQEVFYLLAPPLDRLYIHGSPAVDAHTVSRAVLFREQAHHG